MPIIYANNKNFKEVLENNEVVLIDFYANWCATTILRLVSTISSKTCPNILQGAHQLA